MMAQVETSFFLIMSQVIFGFGCAGCGTAVILGAVGKAVTGKNQTLALGIVMAAGSLGQFLIVPLTGILIDLTSWQQSIIYLCFISLIMILFALSLSISSDSQEGIDQVKKDRNKPVLPLFNEKRPLNTDIRRSSLAALAKCRGRQSGSNPPSLMLVSRQSIHKKSFQ